MRRAHRLIQLLPSRSRLQHCIWIVLTAVMLLAAPAYAIQDTPAPPMSDTPPAASAQAMDPKLTELLAELGRLQEKLGQSIQLPPLRHQSRLLSQLPASTAIYAGFPNYGNAVHQAQQLLHEELEKNPVLHDWSQQMPAAMIVPQVEIAAGQLYQVSQYLGDEIVVSAAINPKGPERVIIMAEIRKPGLRAILQQINEHYAGLSKKPLVRILGPQQLAAAKAGSSTDQVLMLVRPELLVVGFDLRDLKSFNAELDRRNAKFGATPFGQRLAMAYPGGAGTLLGVDVQRIMGQVPHTPKYDDMLRRTGFDDVKYVIVERKDIAAGITSNLVELSFNGPRHGVPSWLGAPAPIGGLDFVSPDAGLVTALVLKSPSQILDDVKDILESLSPNAGTALTMMEEQFKVRLKEDLLSKLDGEITVSIEGPQGPRGESKIILKVRDADGLQQIFKGLMVAANAGAKDGQGMSLERQTDGGLDYYSLRVPWQDTSPVSYTFVDGYLLISANDAALKEGVRMHRSGRSLAKSADFQTLLPKDHAFAVSGLTYRNSARMFESLGQLLPEQAQFVKLLASQGGPLLGWVSAEDRSLRFTANTNGLDVASIAVVAAIAIPNLMRSRTAANEAAAVSTVRTLVTGELTYDSTYEGKGYAPDMATLGPVPDGECTDATASSSHACLLETPLGGPACTEGQWCVKGGYQYSVSGACKNGHCDNFVAVATPVDPSASGKSFCATSDGVVRSKTGAPLNTPVTITQCEEWQPL